MHVELLVSKVN